MLFEHLEAVVKGSMLASVLAYPNLGQVEQRFDKVRVYFDTPLLLRIIGVAPPALQDPIHELLELLYRLNAELYCFESTLEETRGVLSATAKAIGSPKEMRTFFEVNEYLVRSGRTPSYIESILARLEKLLRGRRIRVVDRPPHRDELTVDEDALEQMLKDEVGYKRDETLRHDLDALTAIHRLRGGRHVGDLESCKAIFVTSNYPLTRTAIRFFSTARQAPDVPLCVLDHVLTTLVWLKCPRKAPDLPKKLLIAGCYAAFEPTDSLWRGYLERIEELRSNGSIDDEDYAVLRFSMEARRILMDVTAGDVEAFAEGTPQEVLARAKAEIRAESEDRARSEHAKRVAVEREFERNRAQQLERSSALYARANRWASRTVIAVKYVTLVLLTIGAASTFPWGLMDSSGAGLRYALVLLQVGVLALVVLNMGLGTTVEGLLRVPELWLAARIRRWLIRVGGATQRG